MANLIVVCGPQAVGKMTVAESLRDKLRYNMMMNHDSIEMSVLEHRHKKNSMLFLEKRPLNLQ